MNFGEWIWCVRSEMSFQTFTPLCMYGPMLMKMKKKNVKNQDFNSLTTLVEIFPPVCMTVWDWICCVLSEEKVVGNYSSHMVPCYWKLKKMVKKNKNLNIKKKQTLKNGLERWWRNTFGQTLAFICLTVSEKRTTVDGRTHEDSSSAVQYHKAKLIILYLLLKGEMVPRFLLSNSLVYL